MFPCTRRKGLCYRKEYIEQCWEEAAPALVGSKTVTSDWALLAVEEAITRAEARQARNKGKAKIN